MINAGSILHLPYTQDLTQGGVAYALRSLPYNFQGEGGLTYDRLRCLVAEAIVEIAFRRHLSEQDIPFAVKAALPFTGHDRYDVLLDGRRCEIKPFLIRQREQISKIQGDPAVILSAPALIASDQHAAEGHSPRDLYLFAFVLGEVTDWWNEDGRPRYLIHVMPETWSRPAKWIPLGPLVLKSDSEEMQVVEIGGQDAGGAMRSCTVELPPRARVEVQNGFFSLSYLHLTAGSPRRIGIHSPVRRETYLIEAPGWRNIWVYGLDILLAGFITRDEYRRRASFLPAGSQVFQNTQTQVKNLAVPVSDLRPLSELFERAKIAPIATTA